MTSKMALAQMRLRRMLKRETHKEPQQGIHLPPPDLDGHVVVGDDAGEALGDVAHFHNMVLHGPIPFCRGTTAF